MTGMGKNRTRRSREADARRPLDRVRYDPPGQYGFDLEAFTVSDLRRRVRGARLRRPQHVDFHLLLAVAKGRCTHWVDFVPRICRPGDWIIVRPGQVQRFDTALHWDGWMVLFRPQFLLPLGHTTAVEELSMYSGLDALPSQLRLGAAEHRACLACVEQMCADARMQGREGDRHALLRHQLYALLLRLRLAHPLGEPTAAISPRRLQCFKRFREAVDADFVTTRQVRDYAKRLGYSERSLTRATLEIAGISAKTFVSQRIALEAKRLLAHTSMPVSAIAAQLGMDETTNFVKFFRREVGSAPLEFRRQHCAS